MINDCPPGFCICTPVGACRNPWRYEGADNLVKNLVTAAALSFSRKITLATERRVNLDDPDEKPEFPWWPGCGRAAPGWLIDNPSWWARKAKP